MMMMQILQIMNTKNILGAVTILFIGLMSCQDPYIPTTLESEQEIVVEGYIESGDNANPTFVLVTRSIPFIGKVTPEKLASLFVKDATVIVNDGQKDVTLNRLCLSEIPLELRDQAYQLLGFNPDSVALDLCLYVDLLNSIDRKEGGKYDLRVTIGDKQLTATTTIPRFTGLDSFDFRPTPGVPIDTLSQLFCKIKDPENTIDYYRYFTATGGDGLIPPFTSVTNDLFFNGKDFEFPIARAQRRGQGGGFDPNAFGMFRRGDTITIKWCTLDKAHFDFWNTRDFAANNGGPFGSYTRIITNIKGGLGIWGGYAVAQYELIVPK